MKFSLGTHKRKPAPAAAKAAPARKARPSASNLVDTNKVIDSVTPVRLSFAQSDIPDPDSWAAPAHYEIGIAECRPQVVYSKLLNGKTQVEILTGFTDPSNAKLFTEQLVQGVELALMQGVQSHDELLHLYPFINKQQLGEVLREIQIRFNVSGGQLNVKAARSEMLKKLAFLEAKLWGDWHDISKAPPYQGDIKDKVAIVDRLMVVWDKQASLQGLTKEQIEMVLEVKGDSQVFQAMTVQEDKMNMFVKLIETAKQLKERDEKATSGRVVDPE